MPLVTPAALTFHEVSKSYPSAAGGVLHALREATCEVPQGRVVAIIGRSGSGKSTFLHLAAGIDAPTSGTVRIDGHDLARMGEHERTRLRRDAVGLVFQFFHLLPHLTVQDNVVLPAMIAGDRGARLAASRVRARELLGRVGLEGRAGDSVDKLSGGEMQRVAICRALLRRPRILLADEPTGNLDDDNGRRVMDLLLALVREERGTLVYVTHSRDLAGRADERWRIHSGVLELGADP